MNSQNISEIILNSNYYTKNIIQLIYETGLRVTDIIKIKIDDIDYYNIEYSIINVRKSKFYIKNSLLNRILANQPKEFLFENRKNKPFDRVSFSNKIINEGKRQNIHINQRIIRKAYILNKLSSGLNPRLLCKQLDIHNYSAFKYRFRDIIDNVSLDMLNNF